MKDEIITVPFGAAYEYRAVGKTYWFDGVEGRSLGLPQSVTELVMEGRKVAAVKIPRWLAEKENLVEADSPPFQGVDMLEQEDTAMSRWDWYLLGATLVFLGRSGYTMAEAVWQGKKAARMLLETAKEEE